MGIFFTAIPLGTAVGFFYAAEVASIFGWRYAFGIESGLMLPFVFFMYWMGNNNTPTTAKETKEGEEKTNPFQDVWQLLKRPAYNLTCLGYAAYCGKLSKRSHQFLLRCYFDRYDLELNFHELITAPVIYF